jgi:hypothetical protein
MKGIFFQIYDINKKYQHGILMNDYLKSIGWPCRIKLVQGISYKGLIQILLSACIWLFFKIYRQLWFCIVYIFKVFHSIFKC